MKTNSNKMGLGSLMIYVLVYIAYTSIYVSRINLSVAEPELINIGVFDAAGYGVIAGLFSVIYSIGRFVNGTLSDRNPPYVMLTIGLIGTGVSNLLIGVIPVYIAVLLFWVTNAYAQSMLWSSVLVVVSHLVPEQMRKSMTSVMVTAVATGNLVAILLGGWLVTSIGVEYVFIIPGAMNLVLGALILIFARRIPAPLAATKEEDKLPLTALLRSPDIPLMAVASVFHGVVKENVGVWMVAFVIFTFNVDLSTSAYYVLLIPIIGLVGRLLCPLALKLAGNRENTIIIIGFSVTVAASVALLFAPSLGATMSVILLGIIYAAISMVNTSITSIYPLMYRDSGNLASVAGLLDFTSYLGAGLSGMIYGVVIEYFGYTPMFISWVVISVISIAIILLVNHLRKSAGLVTEA